jgi:ribose/xylose/arabinose/galactoside ABC-type transport system permease subunit
VRSERLFAEYRQPIIAFLSMIAIVVLLSFMSEYFLTVGNLFNIGKQASINLIIALGMTIVIVSAGIDLSVGSLLALTISLTAVLGVVQKLDMVTASTVGVAAAVAAGAINGVVIQYGRVPAFITTLGTMGIARGVVLLISRGNPSMSFPEAFLWIADGTVLGVPFPILVSIVMVLPLRSAGASTLWVATRRPRGCRASTFRWCALPHTRSAASVAAWLGSSLRPASVLPRHRRVWATNSARLPL